MTERFADILVELCTLADVSQNQLARDAFLDPSYIHRLATGQRQPSRAVVTAIAARFTRLPLDLRRRLYLAAGYVPPDGYVPPGDAAWDSLVAPLQEVLADYRFGTQEDLALFRREIQLVCAAALERLDRRMRMNMDGIRTALIDESLPNLAALERERIPSGLF